MVTTQTPGGVQLNLMSVFSCSQTVKFKTRATPANSRHSDRYVNTSQRPTASSPTDKNVNNVRGKLLALSELQQAHHCDDHPMHQMLSKNCSSSVSGPPHPSEKGSVSIPGVSCRDSRGRTGRTGDEMAVVSIIWNFLCYGSQTRVFFDHELAEVTVFPGNNSFPGTRVPRCT